MEAVSVTLFFSLHNRDSFTEELRELVYRANVLLIEQATNEGPDDIAELELLHQEVSDGMRLPGDLLSTVPSNSPEFDGRILQAVYRSQKRMCVERSPFSSRNLQIDFKFSAPRLRLPFDQTLEGYLDQFRKQAMVDRKRDEAVALQIVELNRQQAGQHVLVIRGVSHQRALERLLTDAGLPFSSVKSHDPLLVPVETEIISKLEAGEEVARKELLMMVVETSEIRQLGGPRVREATQSDLVKVKRKVSHMSEKDLETYVLTRLRG